MGCRAGSWGRFCEWVAHNKAEFESKTSLGTYLDIRDARATIALFGKLHYSLVAVCDDEHRLLARRSALFKQSLAAETAQFHKVFGELEDGCVGTTVWKTAIEKMAGQVFGLHTTAFVAKSMSTQPKRGREEVAGEDRAEGDGSESKQKKLKPDA
jgi:hypothetical protein